MIPTLVRAAKEYHKQVDKTKEKVRMQKAEDLKTKRLQKVMLTVIMLLQKLELSSKLSLMPDSLPGKLSTIRRPSMPNGKRTPTTDSIS